MEGTRKGYLFREQWYVKGEGVGLRGGASPYKHLFSTPPPPTGAFKKCPDNDWCGRGQRRVNVVEY